MSHVGWKSGQTALYYMRLAKVLSLSDPSAQISRGDNPSEELFTRYLDLNSLKNFLCAFPSLSSK